MTSQSVLVVEDSFLIAASLEEALLQAGHQVMLAGSVAEAEAAMADTDFLAALLDYMLPDGDSLGLAQQLHAVGCKVAMVSGADRDVVPSDPAISALFAKPMDDRVLVDWVDSIAGQYH
ncbi:MAG: response regulator [Pseudomonadota bacterium]